MTCIAGLVDDEGRVWMGSDSAATSGWDLRRMRGSKMCRLHGSGGDMLFGVSGSPRMAQLLEHHLTLPEHPADLSVEAYLVKHLIPAMRTLFKDEGYARKDNEQEKTDSWVLIGYRGRLSFICGDYQVHESDRTYEAIGCGDSFALGAFYATEHLATKRRLQLALEAAEAFSAGVRGPFTVEVLEPTAQ